MKLPDKVYDILKWIALVVLNAIGVLYKTLAAVWSLPYGEQIMTTCAALALFVGALIGVSTAEYRKDLHEQPTYGKLEDYEE
jgi:hypothetical protein